MTYYDYNGVNYDIDTDDPAVARAKIQAHLGERPGLGDQLSKEVSSVKSAGDVGTVLSKGLVGNTLGAPVDIINMGLQGADYVANKLTGAIRPEAVPYLPKLASENPVGGGQWFNKQMADAGIVGQEQRPLLEAGAGLLPIAPSAVKGAYNVAREIPGAVRSGIETAAPYAKMPYTVPRDMAKGAFLNNKTDSALAPIVEESIVSPAAVEQYMAGKLPKEALSLPENRQQLSTIDRALLKLSGNQAPVRGGIAQATGERIASDFSDPTKIATDVISTGLLGVPFNLAKRGVQAGADLALSNKLKLDPAFLKRYNADIGKPGELTPPAASGPVMPAPLAPENQMMLPLSNNIAPPPGQFNLQPPPGQMPKTIAQQVQDVAASKIIGMPKQDPATAAAANNQRAQAMLAEIRARGTNQPAPAATTPVAPVEPAPFVPPANWTANAGYRAPVGTPTAPTEAPVIQQAKDTLAKLKESLPTPTTGQLAAQEAEVAAHNALTPAEKAAKTRNEKTIMTPTQQKTSNEIPYDLKAIKKIFAEEGVTVPEKTMIEQALLKKHESSFSLNERSKIGEMTDDEIRKRIREYSVELTGSQAIEDAFKAKGFAKVPTHWQIKEIMGADLPPGQEALYRLGQMSKEEINSRIDNWINKHPEKAAQTRSENKASKNSATFDELANDTEGAKEFNITHDIKNKTRTDPNPSSKDITSTMDPKELKALPKNVEWEKSVEHWKPDGSAIAFEEHYTKATKNTPAYKYKENIDSDEPNVLYKKEAGGDWQVVEIPTALTSTTDEIVTMGQGREKPVGVNVAKNAMAEAEAAGKTYDITYRSKGDVIRESNRQIKFTPDPTITLTHVTAFGDGSIVAKGIKDGKSITIRSGKNDKDGKYTIE